MPNRLAQATSTYLLQHAENPVDWWEFSPEAFDEARRRDVPVLLSVGYASCHWCHVMARESFKNPVIAAQLNDGFVAIKVDREQRPDVDAVYMSATQALTGSGGWPMTCFLTADGEPFYAGTYFPPEPAGGLPGFAQLLTTITTAWSEQRDEVLGSASRITEALRSLGSELPPGSLGPDELAAAAVALVDQHDPVDGGFGGAPKFPPAMTLEFLLRHYERTGDNDGLAVVTLTLEKMGAGGLNDQLAGGFARYSVDRRWHVPHFEKMLEDNALLLGVYAHHARLTGSAQSARIARATAHFVLTELLTDDGLFAASLDAEAGGVEGSTYLWTQDELIELLGPADAALATAVFGLDDGPAGQVLRLVTGPAGAPASLVAKMLRRRASRPQPGRDDIAVTRSNGLMISALAEAGAVLDEPGWITAAGRAADRLIELHWTDDGWRHSSRAGLTGPGPATLADHADLAAALLTLHQVTGDPVRLTVALEIIELARSLFGVTADGARGGFYDIQAGKTSSSALIVRPRDPTDGAAPSGTSSMADVLVSAAALTGSSDLRRAAEAAVSGSAAVAARFPRSAGRLLAVAEALVAGPLQIAVSGPPGPARDELVALARTRAPGGSVFAVGRPDQAGLPLLAGRPAIEGVATAYVCRGFVCHRPVTTPGQLAAQLAAAG